MLKHKIICGDCVEVMQEMKGDSVDLVVTSPPYDNLRNYKGYDFDFENIASEIFRIIKKGGVAVWVVGDATINGSETGTSFKQALYFKEIGFNLHDTMIYAKNNYIPLTHNRYEQQFEYMFILSKGEAKSFNPIMIDCAHAGKIIKRSRTTYETGLSKRKASDEDPKPTGDKKQKGNVWSYKVGGAKTVNHVAQFPLQLASDHIISWSNKDDVVLDPFVGSGTTLVASEMLKRNSIGIEISKEYCELAHQRLKNEVEQTRLSGKQSTIQRIGF